MSDPEIIHLADGDDLIKVVIELDPSDWPSTSAESLWAYRLGPKAAVLRNTPFLAYGYSFDDSVELEERDQRLFVKRTLKPGGHSTYRLFLCQSVDLDSTRFTDRWKELEALGCRYESTGRLLAVDVPHASDIRQAYKLFEQGEEAGVWEFEEAHCVAPTHPPPAPAGPPR